MIWWIFNEQQLDECLAQLEAELIRAGATEQQAKDEVFSIKAFLVSPGSAKLIGGRD